MDNPLLTKLRTQREAWQTQLDQIVKRAADENRQELTAEETKSVTDIRSALGPLDERIREWSKDESDRLTALETARKLERQRAGLPPETHSAANHEGPARSWGEQFIESGAIVDYLKGGGKGQSRAIEVAAPLIRESVGERVITSSQLGDMLPTLELPGILRPYEPLGAITLVRRGVTNAPAIQYVQEASFTNNAARVAEGAPKPESNLTFVTKTVVVNTYAHWIAITRQALDDLPMIRGYIDGRLRDGLIMKLDDAILNGDAGDPGLLTNAQAVTGVGLLGAVVAGVEALMAKGYTATGVIANGADFFGLVSSLMDRPTALGDSVITNQLPYRIFGLPIVVTPGIAQGTALVGDFSRGAQLWDRRQTQVLVSDQHADFFIRNQLVLLAEWRGALAIYAPDAFADATITEPPATNGGGADTMTAAAPTHERRRTGA